MWWESENAYKEVECMAVYRYYTKQDFFCVRSISGIDGRSYLFKLSSGYTMGSLASFRLWLIGFLFPADRFLWLSLCSRGPTPHLQQEASRRKRSALWCKKYLQQKERKRRRDKGCILYCKELVSFAEAVSVFRHLEAFPFLTLVFTVVSGVCT